MNKYLAFIEAHPEAFKLIALPIIVAIVNGLTKPRMPEAYAAMPPRLAALLKVLRGVFPDPQQTVDGLVQLLLGKGLSPAAKRASLNPPAIITEKKEEEK